MKTPKSPTRAARSGRLALGSNALLVTLGISLVASNSGVMAAPGDLDPDYGTAGRVFLDKGDLERWDKLLPLPNGDVLIAGWTSYLSTLATGKHLIRVDSKGQRVTSFGNQGQVTLNLGSLPGPSTESSYINELIALPAGGILVVVSQYYKLDSVNRTRISLVRLQSNGSLDTAFGGDGIVEIDTLQANFKWNSGVALDSDGRIVIAGGASTRDSVAVLRLTKEGYLDSSFSGDGMVKQYLSSETIPLTMAVQSDGKVVVAGYFGGSIDSNLMVCRLLENGNLDTEFATAGKLVLDLHGGPDQANAICIRPNGKIVVAGYTRTQPGNIEDFDKSLFVELDQNGALDNSFGIGGIVEIDASIGYSDRINAITLMEDGRIIASCRRELASSFRFTAIRLMPNGLPDVNFAPGGIADIPTDSEGVGADFTDHVARDSSGGILLVGASNTSSGQRSVLIRLLGDPDSDGDGVVDTSETNTGIYVSPFDTGTNPNNQDTDGDGLSDGAESYYHLTNPLAEDTDEDGFLDGYEVQTGKSPTDPLDKPTLVAEARTAIEFSFPSALGKTYRIEDSPDMEAWGTVESGIAGNGGNITRFYSTRNKAKRYFRVEEQAEP